MENHARIGGTVNTSPAKPTIHMMLSWSKMMQNIMRIPAFNPAVNIIFSVLVSVFNPNMRSI